MKLLEREINAICSQLRDKWNTQQKIKRVKLAKSPKVIAEAKKHKKALDAVAKLNIDYIQHPWRGAKDRTLFEITNSIAHKQMERIYYDREAERNRVVLLAAQSKDMKQLLSTLKITV